MPSLPFKLNKSGEHSTWLAMAVTGVEEWSGIPVSAERSQLNRKLVSQKGKSVYRSEIFVYWFQAAFIAQSLHLKIASALRLKTSMTQMIERNLKLQMAAKNGRAKYLCSQNNPV